MLKLGGLLPQLAPGHTYTLTQTTHTLTDTGRQADRQTDRDTQSKAKSCEAVMQIQ